MRRTGLVLAALVALSALGGCGGGGEPTATQSATVAPSDGSPAGTPAPEALSGVTCEKQDKTWTASGVVANDNKEPATYQVTVYVGDATGGEGQARTERLGEVAAGGSIQFELKDVPDGDGPCRVQLVTLG